MKDPCVAVLLAAVVILGTALDRNAVEGQFLLSAPAPSHGAVRTIRFSGYDWIVKSSGGDRVGPGPNYFSESAENVWVDAGGKLHLRITQSERRWHCAEIISAPSFGYGAYAFQVDSEVANLDPRVVLGLFTWSDSPVYSHREIDIEFSRWGDRKTSNSQYVIQPYDRPGNIVRFEIPGGTVPSRHTFVWKPESVFFQTTNASDHGSSLRNVMIQEHLFTKGIPRAGGEHARINLWLLSGREPTDRKQVEVVMGAFQFTPLN